MQVLTAAEPAKEPRGLGRSRDFIFGGNVDRLGKKRPSLRCCNTQLSSIVAPTDDGEPMINEMLNN